MKTTLHTARIVLILLCMQCNDEYEVDDILSNFTLDKKEIVADGQSLVKIKVDLVKDASTDRRNVIFETSGGLFVESADKKHTAKSEFEDGMLVARATLRAPSTPGSIHVSVKPEFDSPLGEFILVDSINAVASVPASINLETSSSGIPSNFLGEVRITGSLKNSSGSNVSTGYKVLFQDYLLSGTPANGRFRDVMNTSNDTSLVGATYGASQHALGTTIYIKATILDDNDQPTGISDSIAITINQ